MVQVQRTFTVNMPCSAVVAYLTDFANAESWDPGTVSCAQVSPGAPEIGSTWRNVSKILGRETELTYVLTHADPRRLTFVGKNKTATSTDDMTFEAFGNTTAITYRSTVIFNGLAKLADPIMRIEFNRLAKELVPLMTRTLESLPTEEMRDR